MHVCLWVIELSVANANSQIQVHVISNLAWRRGPLIEFWTLVLLPWHFSLSDLPVLTSAFFVSEIHSAQSWRIIKTPRARCVCMGVYVRACVRGCVCFFTVAEEYSCARRMCLSLGALRAFGCDSSGQSTVTIK